MHSHAKTGLLCAGLLLGTFLAGGCAKLAPVDGKGPRVAAPVAAKPAPEAAKGEESDPATLLAFKTGVARDKVEEILSIYETNSGGSESGRDIYKIALFASEKTGVATSQVGSVILSYKALVGDGAVKAAQEASRRKKG